MELEEKIEFGAGMTFIDLLHSESELKGMAYLNTKSLAGYVTSSIIYIVPFYLKVS